MSNTFGEYDCIAFIKFCKIKFRQVYHFQPKKIYVKFRDFFFMSIYVLACC